RYIHGNFPVFGPIIELSQLPAEQFSEGVPRVLAQVAGGTLRRKALNPVVVKAFAAVSADSIHSLQDVADVYGKLFAELSPAADDYLSACRAATTTPLTGFEPAMV